MTLLGERIAEGRTAEVHAWGEGQVLKLFLDWVPLDWIESEARIGHGVLPAGLRQALIAVLDELPEGSQLCHGDFHPGNILMTARGPVL